MKQSVVSIKHWIKASMAESLEIRKQIRASEGDERSRLWGCKRSLGDDTRHMLLAYAFLRGRLYSATEWKCAPNNKPRPSFVQHFLEVSLPKGEPLPAEWDKDSIKAWLARPMASEAKEQAA